MSTPPPPPAPSKPPPRGRGGSTGTPRTVPTSPPSNSTSSPSLASPVYPPPPSPTNVLTPSTPSPLSPSPPYISPSPPSPSPPSISPSPPSPSPPSISPSPPSNSLPSISSPPSPPSVTPPVLSPPLPASQNSPPTTPEVSPPHSPGTVLSRPASALSGSSSLVVWIALAAVAVVALLSLFFFCCKKKQRRFRLPVDHHGIFKDDLYVQRPKDCIPNRAARSPRTTLPPNSSIMESGSISSVPEAAPFPLQSPKVPLSLYKIVFTYEELVVATDGFSQANFLGQGGFGYVHRGVLPNGKEIAVKQLKSGSGQGEREFKAEVEIISHVHHRHLVSLVGYCISGGQRLLVYEYVPNRTLDFHLHGKSHPTMDWSTRLKIALGAAKGLAYLHEDCHPKIIHRDIKAANILLDHKYEAKVADFGLAKFASDTDTHVSTQVMGTIGYLAPEYASSGKLTDKSDVFSFGVLLLELLSGKSPINIDRSSSEDSLVEWGRPLMAQAMEDGDYAPLIDPYLGNNYNHNEVVRFVACAAACVRHSARQRPRMSQIVRVLEGDITLEDLNEGIRPGHSSIMFGSFIGGSTDDQINSSRFSRAIKKFRNLMFRGSSTGSRIPTSGL